MVSGGMSIMGDEQIDALIKTGQEVRKERDPNFLSADAQYLQEYVEISEGFILSRTSLRSAVDSLAELNKKFEIPVSTWQNARITMKRIGIAWKITSGTDGCLPTLAANVRER
jgi:hypothetical protein